MKRIFRVKTAAIFVGILTVTSVSVSAAVAQGPGKGTPGAQGIGDPYFPKYGNGGYDVDKYDIDIDYEPATDKLVGTATIVSKAEQDLSSFNLDFILPVNSVTVNGIEATAKSDQYELTITPKQELRKGEAFVTTIQYAGVPSNAPPVPPGTSSTTINPWLRMPDGAVAMGEPEIAAYWFPSNDHPRDKASYEVDITVPQEYQALSNGILTGQDAKDGKVTWRWKEDKPKASYLAFLAVGKYDISSGKAKSGKPFLNAVAQNTGAAGEQAKADLARTPEIVDWLEELWGKYPFEALGGVMIPHHQVSFALETQTRPVYGERFFQKGSNTSVVVHEMAHQWFGNSVSVYTWKDLWLNEGFARYAEWLWSEKQGDKTAQQKFDEAYNKYPAEDPYWKNKIGDPGPTFKADVYGRGAMTLHALKNRVGDDAFFKVLRKWVAEHRYGNATTPQLVDLSEKVSGQELDQFFNTWLFAPERPASTAENGFPR